MAHTNSWWEKARPTKQKCFVCGKKKNVRTNIMDVGSDADGVFTPIPWQLCGYCKRNSWVPINAGMVLAYRNIKLRKVKTEPDRYEKEEFLCLFGL